MSFVRPEARASIWRWRETLMGTAILALGLWWMLGTPGLLQWIGGAVAPWVLVPRFATSPHTPGGAGLGTTTFSGGSFGGGSVGGGFGGGSVGGW